MENPKRIEEISLNGWPALQTLLYDGWLLRFADGYSKRSNSVNPLYGSAYEVDEKIAYCESLYKERGQAAVFKVTPFAEPAGLDAKLEERGYAFVDHTLVKTASLLDLEPSTYEDVVIATELTSYWLDTIAELQGLNADQKETTRRMMEGQPLRKAFVVVRHEGAPAACGMAVIEQGYAGLYDIVTDPKLRGRGYGEILTRHLLGWAKEQGAERGYLLVVKNNEAANRLYDKFGFRQLYDYWYRVKKV
ncbi:GNAT family N-acetyltransferase [Paenibacillus nanensis]|nr:GNAT family N-acetyltransferase [Paenibacillus nanensis]